MLKPDANIYIVVDATLPLLTDKNYLRRLSEIFDTGDPELLEH